MGGVDLSFIDDYQFERIWSPRPCGRGGFKRVLQELVHLGGVPARVGGVDLSTVESIERGRFEVPARVGGVDLSSGIWITKTDRRGPRPCGRGGFKRERGD